MESIAGHPSPERRQKMGCRGNIVRFHLFFLGVYAACRMHISGAGGRAGQTGGGRVAAVDDGAGAATLCDNSARRMAMQR